MENQQDQSQPKNIHTRGRLAEVASGLQTLDGLKARRAEYEDPTSLLFHSINSDNPIGRKLRLYYDSICEAIRILEQDRTASTVEQQVNDILRDLDF